MDYNTLPETNNAWKPADPMASPSTNSTKHEMTPALDAEKGMANATIGHLLSPSDPENPFKWAWQKKVYVSAAAFALAFTVAFGLTAYTAGITGVIAEFDVSMTTAVSGFSLYLFGIVFAPILTPHFSERYGRTMVYLVSFPIFCFFTLGAGYSKSFAALAVCRFFAGFFGGPALVLIEGTFADVWSADMTVTYYSILTLASFMGAGSGPLVGGFVFAATNWRWTQYITLMLALASYLLAIGMSESYGRHILRHRARRNGQHDFQLVKAQSGESYAEMFHITFLSPLKMMVSEPVVMLISLYLGFNFAIIFSFFISIPVVLTLTYSFSISEDGTAFSAALLGSVLAAASSMLIDRMTYRKHAMKQNSYGGMDVEYRLIPAMWGAICIIASLFWIAFTASPKFNFLSPIFGTALYVWGNMSVLIGFISYLFDAYPAQGTLAALTMAASWRLSAAGILSLLIIQIILQLTGQWAYAMMGFISAAFAVVPFILYKWGPALRARSRYNTPFF